MSVTSCTSGDSGALVALVRRYPRLKPVLKRMLDGIGYDTADWMRVVMYRRAFEEIEGMGPETLDVLEISAGPQWRRRFRFRSYTEMNYPDWDICSDRRPGSFDLIIADQVFEHLKWPARAARNVHAMLRPGGVFFVATPFLVRVHASPIDCSRWTPTGLSCLLQEAGFPESGVTTDSWGNRACLKANLTRWRKRGLFGSLENEPDFPVMVWAFARKPDGAETPAVIAEADPS
ncbi:methyltransferase domain-containing protein [Rhodoplanes sp. TEM]|uniref:Methyltransferase domain-containing protein n=1 Tax=Rhodoplanes tepidamans TaxID=200616 RepID=A0ABT5J869_RHOTP|nr:MULTISPECIES: methyltransferase domain-containing protein [Rhodoplanes]MDC7785240.1 methyltransferase domain-containing protein [Rhodoplanes tepidamans]MDC7986408.1 methyltransferase domain-containing protein [Rhodoplanes sp. TEM]MDQ0353498.1 SAM-dependent methyltransferase [Rhodoplanes tepidamans]